MQQASVRTARVWASTFEAAKTSAGLHRGGVDPVALRTFARARDVRVFEVDRVPSLVARVLEGPARRSDQVALSPSFLGAYFEAPPCGVRPGLLVASTPDAAVAGVSAIARYDVPLDCLASRRVQRFAAAARRPLPGFLKTRVLMCGLPAGLGGFETLIAASDDATATRVRAALIERSLAIAQRERAAAVVWKELDDRRCEQWAAPLAAAGFLRQRSVPTVVQDLRFASVADYEAALRANYRHQLRANLKRAADAGLTVELGQPLAAWVDRWYPLFAQVLDRSATRLETLGPDFFARLAADPRYSLNTAVCGDKLVGGALCTADRGTLHFLYVGMDYAAARGCDLYFNLLYSVLRLAVERGCTKIHWGQTSLNAKGRFGGVAEPLSFFLRFARPPMQRLMGGLGPLLFPERRQTARHVLRS